MIQDSRMKSKASCRLCRPGQKLKHAKFYRKEIEWAKKHGKHYNTAEEMFADIFRNKSVLN